MKKTNKGIIKFSDPTSNKSSNAYRTASSASNFQSDSQNNFRSGSKKKGDEKAVVLGIGSNKNSMKDGNFKIHHYKNDYDPELNIESSQIVIKRKDQLIALDKYIFEDVPSFKKKKKNPNKKVNIIESQDETPQASKELISHRHRIRNPHIKPTQITSTAVLTPDGQYQPISSTDGEYITLDSSAIHDSTETADTSILQSSKVKFDSSISSDYPKKNLSPTKSIQAELESSFVDSTLAISPRNPHGLWKKQNQENKTIEEIEYEYVSYEEEEEEDEKKAKKRAVSLDFSNVNNGQDEDEEEEIIYEIIEEEEEEEAEDLAQNEGGNKEAQKEETDEARSNSLADVKPLNVFNKKKNRGKRFQSPDYYDENDYATTEDNINTQSFINNSEIKAPNEEDEDEGNENKDNENQNNEINGENQSNEISNENRSIENKDDEINSENRSIENKSNEVNSENKSNENNKAGMNSFEEEEEENSIEFNKSDQVENDSKLNNSNLSQSNKNVEKSDSGKNDEAVENDTNQEDVQGSSNQQVNNEIENPQLETESETNAEKKIKFENTLTESIDLNEIPLSAINQSDAKGNDPTVSVFNEYVFADENPKNKEEEPKANLVIGDGKSSNVNESSFGFNHSQMPERSENKISGKLDQLVSNRNQILKSEIDSASININIVDEFSNIQNSSNSKKIRKLFLSPSNAIESRAGKPPESEISQMSSQNETSKTTSQNTTESKSTSKSQFEFENNSQSSDNELDKTNDPTITTCDLDMSNIQRSPPPVMNRHTFFDQPNQLQQPQQEKQQKSFNSDEYYSHEYYTTLETNEISKNGKYDNNNNNKSNKNSKRYNNKKSDDDSYYSYYSYSDTYSYSYEPSTINDRSKRHRQHRRKHQTETTYEYITNDTYETYETREVRPIENNNSRQLPMELQQQIQQQLQQQVMSNLNNSPQNPYVIKLRVKESQMKLFNLDNGQSPKFVLKTVAKDGKATPHDVKLLLDNKVSSSCQTSGTNSRSNSASDSALSVPLSPTQIKNETKNNSSQRDVPQIVESGPHKGMIRRRIKRSEKLKRDEEKLMKVEEQIKEMEKAKAEQEAQRRNLVDTSVEITGSYLGSTQGANSPLAKQRPTKAKKAMRGGKGKKSTPERGSIINENDDFFEKQASNQLSKSSKAASSNLNSPNRRRYFDENGNPVLVEVSDPNGKTVFRRIASKQSASSSVKNVPSNTNSKPITRSLPRPTNRELNVETDQRFSTPKRMNKRANSYENDSLSSDDDLLKNSPKQNEDDIESEDDENFNEADEQKGEIKMEFGKVFRSRKAPHIKKPKFQNRQIYLRHRDGNSSNGNSGGATPMKRHVFDSDSDSDSSGEFLIEPRNYSPDSKKQKDENEQFNSKRKVANKQQSPSPAQKRRSPRRLDSNDNEYDPFEDFDENFDNIQRSPYDASQNMNMENNGFNFNNEPVQQPRQLVLNPRVPNPSDGSASSLTERRKLSKLTVEIPPRGNEGQADIFRRHYENNSPEKELKKAPERYRDFNEYEEDDSVPLNASTKNTFKNLEEENVNEKENRIESHYSNSSAKRKAKKRIRVSLTDGSRLPAPHSSNTLKESPINSPINSPSQKERESIGRDIKPFIENLKARIRSDYSSSDSKKGNEKVDNQDEDFVDIEDMNPVQAAKFEEAKRMKSRGKDVMPLTPPPDADLTGSSSMLSNVPPPSPKNQDVEIVIKNGKRKRKKKVPISPGKSGSHSSKSSKYSSRGKVIHSHHLKDSEKYQESPPPSMLSSIVNEDDIEEEVNSSFIQN